MGNWKKIQEIFKDIIVRNDLEEVVPQVEGKVIFIDRHLFEETNEEYLSLLDLITNINAFIPVVPENTLEFEYNNPRDRYWSSAKETYLISVSPQSLIDHE